MLSAAPSSQVRASSILLLLIVGNVEARRFGSLLRHNAYTKFRDSQLTGPKVECEGHKDSTVIS
jgi:hypothetical protein